MKMRRRDFIKAAGTAMISVAGSRALAGGAGDRDSMSFKEWFALHRGELREVMDFIQAEIKRIIDRRIQTPRGRGPKLPYPYVPVIDSPGWSYMFYWDTYFIVRQLLHDGHLEVAKNQVRNLMYLFQRYGYVPNANYYLWAESSQPPLLTGMVRAINDCHDDPAFLNECYPVIKREYEKFWRGPLHLVKDKGFSRYQPGFYGAAKLFGYPPTPLAQTEAEAESGWDFTPRFEKHCLNFLPVDLNSFLYKYELDLCWMADRLDLGPSEQNLWRKRAEVRKENFSEIFWDRNRGFFFDYNFKSRRPSQVWSMAGYLPLWVGLAGAEQIKGAADALPRFQKAHGLAVCDQDYGIKNRQWNYPNSWPPLTWWVEESLRANGFTKEAELIIMQYLDVQTRLYQKTGAIWEKYNAVSGGLDVTGGHERHSNPMLGWSASAFTDFFTLAEKA